RYPCAHVSVRGSTVSNYLDRELMCEAELLAGGYDQQIISADGLRMGEIGCCVAPSYAGCLVMMTHSKELVILQTGDTFTKPSAIEVRKLNGAIALDTTGGKP
ncbi:MAG TPA: hypothetical protein VIV60_20300, partial [Polyangiaceae bacterium]